MTQAPEPTGQILLYRSEDGRTKLDVRLENETVWLSQRQLTEPFGKAKGTLSEHIKHIFEDGELDPAATVRPFRTVQREGDREVSRDVDFYNLDMVIALGFRVRSPPAVRFRSGRPTGSRGVAVISRPLRAVRVPRAVASSGW
ncbi:MAG TPA: RhuM family protein [Kofleriaceae bacterium]